MFPRWARAGRLRPLPRPSNAPVRGASCPLHHETPATGAEVIGQVREPGGPEDEARPCRPRPRTRCQASGGLRLFAFYAATSKTLGSFWEEGGQRERQGVRVPSALCFPPTDITTACPFRGA